MIASLAALLLVAFATPQEEDAFRANVMERLQKANPGSVFVNGDEPLVIRVEGGVMEDGTLNLHRIYEYCRNNPPADCETATLEYMELVRIGAPPPEAANLRIVVRDHQYVEYIEDAERQSGERQAIRRPLGGGLFAILAMDSPYAIGMVGDAQLEQIALDEESAWTLAEANMAAVLPAIPSPEAFAGRAYAFELDEYASSLVANVEAWSRIAEVVGPDFFLTVVSDQFVFAGELPAGPDFEAFRQSVEQDCAAQPRCISPEIFRIREGAWTRAPSPPVE